MSGIGIFHLFLQQHTFYHTSSINAEKKLKWTFEQADTNRNAVTSGEGIHTIELEPGKILIIELINFDDWEKEWLERDTRASRRGLILGAPPTTI